MVGVNRVAAALLGVVLLVAGVLTVVVTALAAAGYSSSVVPLPRWRDTLSTTAWSDRQLLGLSIVVGLVGIAILVLELRPWRPRQIPTVAGPAGGLQVSRRSVESQATMAAESVTGVRRVKVTSRHRRRGWSLRMTAEAEADRREPVTQAVKAELARLGMAEDMSVDVDLHRRRIM